jgi:hypothetical protein
LAPNGLHNTLFVKTDGERIRGQIIIIQCVKHDPLIVEDGPEILGKWLAILLQ